MTLDLIDFDKDFDHTKIINSHNIFSKKNTTVTLDGEYKTEQKKYNDNSIFSPSIFGNMDIEEDYSCSCGKFVGQFYEGVKCGDCDSIVEFSGLSVDRFGWIDLSLDTYDTEGNVLNKGNGVKIIKYIAYQFLEKLIGRESLKNITHARNTLNIEGDIDEDLLNEDRDSEPRRKYWWHGLLYFYNNYSEILDYYYNLDEKNKEKNKKLYDYLKYKNVVFIDKIPVISPVLRPVRRTPEGLQLSGINIYYQNILKELSIISDPTTIDIVRAIFTEQIQADYFQLCDETIKTIDGKSGLIKGQITGTRLNMSARNLITPPDPDLQLDEAAVPYQTFLELWRFELIHILMETEKCTLKEAEKQLFRASVEFDNKIWKLMNHICENENICILFGRNPSINLGSILGLKVVKVKSDINDISISCNVLLLSLLGADYDGDVLHLVSLKDKTIREVFMDAFSPKKLIINPDDGMFNTALNLERDQLSGLTMMLSDK